MTLDPFFDEFHRRQPDVRVVLLPPTAPQETPPPAVPVDAVTAAARATRARQAARGHLESLWVTAAPDRPVPADVRYQWEAGDVPGTVRATASGRHDGAVADLRGDLTVARDRLLAEGWTVQARPVGPGGARLLATLDEVNLEVVVWGPEGPWDVTVSATAVVGEHSLAVRTTGATVTPWDTPAPQVEL